MKQYINIPNALSFFRLISPLIIIPCFLNGEIIASGIVFIIAAMLDYLDGITARKFNLTSVFGAVLDPLADKTLVISMYIFFMLLGNISWLTSTMVVARDVFIMCGVLFLKMGDYKLEFKPLWSSKLNTTIQLIFLLFVYLGRIVSSQILEFVIIGLEIAVVISVLISGYDYYKLAFEIVKTKNN